MTIKSDDDGRTTVGPDGLTTTRKFNIRVTGVSFSQETPKQIMEDMLRYDNAVIEELTSRPKDRDKRVRIFTADIWCERYTPERWHSFGLSSTPLNGPFHNNDGNGYIYQTFTRDNT